MRYVPALTSTSVALSLLLVVGCTSEEEHLQADASIEDTDPSLERFDNQQLSWKDCHDANEVEELLEWGAEEKWLESLECTLMNVPLDYTDPDGEDVRLALVRRPAEGGAEDRQGSLVINPGGPGGSGLEMLTGELFTSDIRDSFDLVSFDPRGIGDSTPISCGEDHSDEEGPWEEYLSWDTDPADIAEDDLVEMDEIAQEVAEECVDEIAADFLANMGTVNVARDMDLIRENLDEDELHYVGYSYGTHLGALYAELYPDNVGGMVLDGAVDGEIDLLRMAVEQTEGFQETWERFVEQCSDCPFDDPEGSTETMTALARGLDDDPIVIDDPEWHDEEVVIDGDALIGIVMQSMYQEWVWPDLEASLVALNQGDLSEAVYQLSGLYWMFFLFMAEEEAEENQSAAQLAVECADSEAGTDLDAYREASEAAYEASPLFGSTMVWPWMMCSHWVEPVERLSGFSASDAPPIVVVGTEGDPATPYEWSRRLADQLDSATLVTYEGAGHGVYGFDANECVDEVIDTYLLEGVVPESDHSCLPE